MYVEKPIPLSIGIFGLTLMIIALVSFQASSISNVWGYCTLVTGYVLFGVGFAHTQRKKPWVRIAYFIALLALTTGGILLSL